MLSARWRVCVCIFAACYVCVCVSSPWGKNTLLFLGSPTPLSHPCILRDPLSRSRHRTHVLSRGCGCSSFNVCVCVGGECISGKMSKNTWLLRPLHAYIQLFPLSPSILHHLLSQCEYTLAAHTHTLLAREDTPPPVVACLHTPARTHE